MRKGSAMKWLAGVCLAALAFSPVVPAAAEDALNAGASRVRPPPPSVLTPDILPKKSPRAFAAFIGPPAGAILPARPVHDAAQLAPPMLRAGLASPPASWPATAREPELPPEVRDPPTIEAAPGGRSGPVANLRSAPLTRGPAAPDPASAPAAASGPDILAALSAMDARPVLARPLGAGDWRAARDAVRAFYAGRSYQPAWTADGALTSNAKSVRARLARAGEDGIDLFALTLPPASLTRPTPAQLAQADVALTQAIVAYAVEASGGRIDPARLGADISERPVVANPVRALELVLAARDPGATLQDFNPPQSGYRGLRDKLAQIRAGNPALGANPFPVGPTLKVGMVDPRVALIRTRFGLDQDLDAASTDALLYDSRVASAVAGFQRANGLKGNGVLNAGTALALAGGDAARQESIVLANMEMWRREPRDMGEERVEVNVPDFTLKVMRGEQVIHNAKVIVGKPDTQTPIFSNELRYILLNPSWHVPQSIIKKEMLPKLAKDPDYLTRMGFEVVQKGDSIMVRQPPGERNALGRILFMFPNDHNVYLHDTPARGLFGTLRRAYSHGCVRVDQPLELGEIVMGGAANGWSQQRLRSLVGGGEQSIFLPRRIAIHIEYFTAFVDESGDLQMRDDLYGHMRRVQDALGLPSQG